MRSLRFWAAVFVVPRVARVLLRAARVVAWWGFPGLGHAAARLGLAVMFVGLRWEVGVLT